MNKKYCTDLQRCSDQLKSYPKDRVKVYGTAKRSSAWCPKGALALRICVMYGL